MGKPPSCMKIRSPLYTIHNSPVVIRRKADIACSCIPQTPIHGGQIFWFVIIHLRPIIPYGHPTDTTDRPRIHPFRSPFRQLTANKKLSSPDVSACRQTSLSKDVSHFIPASTKVVKRYQPSHLKRSTSALACYNGTSPIAARGSYRLIGLWSLNRRSQQLQLVCGGIAPS